MSVRAVYENDASRAAEAEIVSVLTEKWKLTDVLKLSMAYGLDYAMLRDGEVVGFAEIKDRDFGFGNGDGYWLALQKVLKANLLILDGWPCVLVVRFRGGAIYRAMFSSRDADRLIVAGRADRGDPLDREPCVIFPWSAFRLVEEQAQ